VSQATQTVATVAPALSTTMETTVSVTSGIFGFLAAAVTLGGISNGGQSKAWTQWENAMCNYQAQLQLIALVAAGSMALCFYTWWYRQEKIENAEMEQTLIKFKEQHKSLIEEHKITLEDLDKLKKIRITGAGTVENTEINDSPDISE
jgi:hypothetical protein